MSAIRTLLRSSIDYAGLFPPAALDMATAVANYARYRTGPAAWALGRFIVPLGRLSELEWHWSRLPRNPMDQPWLISVLSGADPAGDLAQISEFNARHSRSNAAVLTADTMEFKATSESSIAEVMRYMPPGVAAYSEIPINEDPKALITAIRQRGARAKVRTGGVTPEAFPETSDLLRFLTECLRAGVLFKATAGLHHPLRAEYPLTYASESPRGTMFGFLNLFLAVASLRAGISNAEVAALLEERSPAAFQVDDSGIRWRDRRLGLGSLQEARERGIVSFGSCSFTEPIQELESLHLLEPRIQRA